MSLIWYLQFSAFRKEAWVRTPLLSFLYFLPLGSLLPLWDEQGAGIHEGLVLFLLGRRERGADESFWLCTYGLLSFQGA